MEWIDISFSLRDLHDPGIELRSPAVQAGSLPSEPPRNTPPWKFPLGGEWSLPWTDILSLDLGWALKKDGAPHSQQHGGVIILKSRRV